MSHQPTSQSSAGPGSAGLRPGDKLDKYTIVQQIGAGGMAIVWKGHDPVLDRVVAIKEFNAAAIEAQGQDLANRFRGEAQLQKKLAKSSPHLVQVLDFIDENRGLFIIMEYVQGRSLEQLLSQTTAPIDRRQALGIVGAAALALGVIHKHGVVHRDLKPSNILLPDAGGLKVSDFGLAAIIGDQEAMAVGTVRYMAPELFREEPVDGKADIYSLGMIAYEMLAGRERFNEAFKVVLRDQRNQALRWMKWHANPRAKAPPLSQVNPDVPQGLSELVARMMEKDAASRVASTQELLDAMRRLLSPSQSTAAVAPAASTGQPSVEAAANPTAALPKRSRLPVILAVILGMQVLLIGGLFYHQHSKQAAVVQDRENRGQRLYAQAVETYKAGDYVAAHEQFEEVLAGWGDDAKLRAAAQAGVHLSQARLDIDAGAYGDALANIEAARKLDAFKPATLDNLRQEAQSRSAFQGEVQAIGDMMDRSELGMARTRLEKLNGATATERDIIQSLNNRLQALQSNARDDRMIVDATAERASKGPEAGIRYLEMQLASRPSEKARKVLDQWKLEARYEGLLAQAAQLESQGKLNEAIALLAQAQQIRSQPAQDQQIRQLRIRTLLARAQQQEQEGNQSAAGSTYTEILGLDKDNAQAKAALARIDVGNRRAGFLRAAQSAMNNRQYDQAIQQYRNALEISEDADTRQALNTARLRQAIEQGQAALNANQLPQARKHIEAALAISPDDDQAKDLLGQVNNRQQYIKLLASGDALREKAKFPEAQREYLQAQRIAKTPEIVQRLADTEVLQMLAQSRYYISKEEWRTARAMLRTLLEKRPHEEAQKLLEEVNKHVPLSPEEQEREKNGK